MLQLEKRPVSSCVLYHGVSVYVYITITIKKSRQYKASHFYEGGRVERIVVLSLYLRRSVGDSRHRARVSRPAAVEQPS